MKQMTMIFLKWLVNLFLPSRPLVAAQIQKVLIIKLCCIGDVLFTTPLIRALKDWQPRLKLTYMVSSWCRPLVEADPLVEAILEFNAYDRCSWWQKFKLSWAMVRTIRKQRFDLAIVLHRTPLAGLLPALAGVPVRVGFDWQGRGFSHTHPVAFDPKAHEIDRHLACLRPLGIATQDKQPQLSPDARAREAAQSLLAEVKAKTMQGPLIVLFPGGGVNPGTVMTSKRWTLEGYRKLGTLLQQDLGARLVLVGNDDDRRWNDRLLKGAAWAKDTLRLEGKTTLMILAAVLEQCDLFIGGDSGPLHLADAVGCATVSLFGPTDPTLLAPRGPRHRVVRKELSCSPCFTPADLQHTTCWQGSLLCMTSIEAEEVLAAAQDLLSQKGFFSRESGFDS